MNKIVSIVLKTILPVLLLAASVYAGAKLVANAPEPKPRTVEERRPMVRALPAAAHDGSLVVSVYGRVRPRTEIDIVPQVSGKVVRLSENLREGGFFAKGETLLEIERRDYELAVTRAEAAVARAKAGLEREQAEAAVAKREWEKFGEGEGNPLALREPQLAQARADLDSANAALEAAKLDLSRTEIRAPFAGRVRRESVDVGQLVGAGSPVATAYATDAMEVALAVPDRELARVDLPMSPDGEGPVVRLVADLGGTEAEWEGRVVRTGAEVDPRSRVVRALVLVEDPFRKGRTPLLPGTYVRAEIPGRTAATPVEVPRAALVGGDRVLVVDGESRLRIRPVEVLMTRPDTVVVAGDVAAGDRVSVTPLDPAIEGMKVEVSE